MKSRTDIFLSFVLKWGSSDGSFAVDQGGEAAATRLLWGGVSKWERKETDLLIEDKPAVRSVSIIKHKKKQAEI